MERKLHDTEILNDQGWKNAVQIITESDGSFESSSRLYGMVLADAVLERDLSLKDLKSGVSWANDHDREAVLELGPKYDSHIIHPADLLEARSRRLAHHAGRWALRRVSSQVKLLTYRSKRECILAEIVTDIGITDFNLLDYSYRIRVVG